MTYLIFIPQVLLAWEKMFIHPNKHSRVPLYCRDSRKPLKHIVAAKKSYKDTSSSSKSHNNKINIDNCRLGWWKKRCPGKHCNMRIIQNCNKRSTLHPRSRRSQQKTRTHCTVVKFCQVCHSVRHMKMKMKTNCYQHSLLATTLYINCLRFGDWLKLADGSSYDNEEDFGLTTLSLQHHLAATSVRA